MALIVTGVDANGRVTPKGTNVVIPPESAGIGDLIYKSSGGVAKVIGRGTASSSSITISGTSYTLWGVIYGFVNGYAMVLAPKEGGTKQWGSYPTGAPTWGGGTVLMRNGNKATYAQMNTKQNANYIKGGSTSPVKLTSAYQATALTGDTDFNALSATSDIKKHYGSWTEYIRQALRVNGAPGTPFGAVYDGCKVHEFGRWMGRTYFSNSTNFPTTTAGGYCYAYGNGGGEWWLPSMFELGELMIDEHLDKVNENVKADNSYFDSVSAVAGRWSCVLFSSSHAWTYGYFGMSADLGFADTFAVRPVTLFKLV